MRVCGNQYPAVAAVLIVLALAASARAAAAGPGYSLRADADRAGVMVGSALRTQEAMDDPAYMALLRAQVNAVTPEGETKMWAMEPERGRFDFSLPDRIADFAWRNGMRMRGHVLIWHHRGSNPQWINEANFSRPEAKRVLRRYIFKVVGHFRHKYPGLVVQWDVVNEGIDNDGTRRQGHWQRMIGDDYMDLAFKWARKAAGPDVKLFYNDYFDAEMIVGAEYLTGGEFDDGDQVPSASPGATGPLPCEAIVKCAAVKELVTGMVRRGVPIDGVGFQAHIPNPRPADYATLTDWVGELGLQWAVTEMDVPVPDGSGDYGGAQHQADTYSAVAQACLDDPACSTIVTWGISDRYTWWSDLLGGFLDDALHFDADLEPKPAAEALHKTLARAERFAGPCARPLRGSRRSERLVGTWAGDRVRGERGADRIRGLRGRDCLIGGRGADRISARDGERDLVRCGRARDRALVDRIDRVRGCESVGQ